MAETEFYDHITQGPRPNPKKAITLHRTIEESTFYMLAGEVFGVEKIIDTKDYQRREQCRVYPIGGQPFLVKESADTVLALLGWMVE